MSADTSTRLEPVVTEEDEEGNIHTTCCLDDNLAMCGRDVTDDPWMEFGEVPECETCKRLWEADTAAGCYAGECNHCPRNVLGGLS